jgi:peptide-methionine (S)-S-oxide reductase
MIFGQSKKRILPEASEALPGRAEAVLTSLDHAVFGRDLLAPYPPGLCSLVFGLGCFWGAERKFWQIPGVYLTAAGYAGGFTPNPTYEEVCSGRTGHTEVVLVVYDPQLCSLQDLLSVFWSVHNPTQGMRQGNDIGTQYRSAIYLESESDFQQALESRVQFQQQLNMAGFDLITTEIKRGQTFYFAEDYHQQYLAKNPNGYCGLAGTGVHYTSQV